MSVGEVMRYLSVPGLTPKPKYPLEAEAPIVHAFVERSEWINVAPTAIATTALTALRDAGWRLMPPARTEADDA